MIEEADLETRVSVLESALCILIGSILAPDEIKHLEGISAGVTELGLGNSNVIELRPVSSWQKAQAVLMVELFRRAREWQESVGAGGAGASLP